MTPTTTERLYTFEEYITYDEDPDNRYELVDGRLVLMNPPTFRYLLISDYIQDSFKTEIRRLSLPWLCFREAGVRTGWRKSRLPDVYIVAAEQVMEFIDQSANLVDVAINQDLKALICKPELEPKYLLFFLLSKKEELESGADGATVKKSQ